MTAAYGYVLLAVVAGAMLPLQATINAALAPRLGSALWAAAVTGLVMAAAIAAAAVAWRLPLPRPSVVAAVPLWLWTGGLFGGFLLAASIAVTPRLGAAAMVACVVAGQLLCSLALDHFGLLGLPEHRLNPQRVLGVALLAAGVVLIRFY